MTTTQATEIPAVPVTVTLLATDAFVVGHSMRSLAHFKCCSSSDDNARFGCVGRQLVSAALAAAANPGAAVDPAPAHGTTRIDPIALAREVVASSAAPHEPLTILARALFLTHERLAAVRPTDDERAYLTAHVGRITARSPIITDAIVRWLDATREA